MAKVIEKACVPMFLDEDNEPCAFLYFNMKTKVREIYVCKQATEEQIIRLYEDKDGKLKNNIGKASVTIVVDPPGLTPELGPAPVASTVAEHQPRKGIFNRTASRILP